MSENALCRLAGAAVAIVAAIAAIVSFAHIESLSLALGQTTLASALMPASIDGSIAASSLALLSAARRKGKTPRVAQAMLTAGVLATLSANAYSGMAHGAPGIVLAMWPGIAFIGSTEVALRMVRQTADDKLAADRKAAREASAKPVTRTAEASRKIRRARTLLTATPAMTTADLARKLGVSTGTAKRYRQLAADAPTIGRLGEAAA